MERVSEMEEYIREYRNIRQSEKSGMIEKEYHCLLPSLYTYMDSLIKEQIFRRKSDGQEGIKHILFFRLLSSGYTGSGEIALGMSNSMIYLDDNFSCVYWKPDFIYESIDEDLVREKVISDSMLEIYQYGLVRMFEIGAAVLTSLAIGMCVGMLKQTLLFFLFFIPLRSYLGGFHLRKYRDCYLMSCLTLAAVLAITRFASFDMHVSCGLIVASSVGIGLEAGLARKKQESGIYALVVWAVLIILLVLTAVCYLRREQQTLVLLCCVTVIVLVSKRAERIS